MKLIILDRGARAARCLSVSMRHAWFAGVGVVSILASAISSGYFMADSRAGMSPDVLSLHASVQAQQDELRQLQLAADEELNALALRMGQLNAHVIRLNALGGRLTSMAGLDDGEFDFSSMPALGGPVELSVNDSELAGRMPNLLADMATMNVTLDGQRQQLATLEGQLLNRKLHERVLPNGRPVRSGWISSFYGKRSDPMSGRTAWHKGIDFAGRRGSEIVAVSDGVVSFAGSNRGYGNMVEIKHGNGFVTRYAHNQDNLVAVGDKVTQGQPIALMGSTGRSTGPHVHFEVHRNGLQVDPAKYIAGR